MNSHVLQLQVPPNSNHAEVSLLGSLLLDGETFHEIADLVVPEDFYREQHRYIFAAIVRLAAERAPIDIVSVAHQLRAAGQLDTVGGVAYVGGLPREVPTAANVAHYAEIVRRMAIRRTLIHRLAELREQLYGDIEGGLDVWIDRASAEVLEAGHRIATSEARPLSELIPAAVEVLGEQTRAEGATIGVPTGFTDLDKLTGGLRKGWLAVLAARTSAGKSAMAWNIALNAAAKGHCVYYVSLEMETDEFAERALATVGRVDLRTLVSGKESENFPRVVAAAQRTVGLPVWLEKARGLTPQSLRAKARRLRARVGLSLVVVDYLQIMKPGLPGRTLQTKEAELAHISEELKELAGELGCPVLALAQLNRGAADGSRPQMSQIRGSGAIEHDADLCMLIWKKERYARQVTLIVDKQRGGGIDDIDLDWTAQWVRFDDKGEGQLDPDDVGF